MKFMCCMAKGKTPLSAVVFMKLRCRVAKSRSVLGLLQAIFERKRENIKKGTLVGIEPATTCFTI